MTYNDQTHGLVTSTAFNGMVWYRESMLKEAGFGNIHTDIVDREPEPPHFQTLMAAAWKGENGNRP